MFCKPFAASLLALFILAACSPAAEPLPAQSATPTYGPRPTQGADPFPLAEKGQYAVGVRTFKAADASRAGKEISLRAWFPAVMPPDPNEKFSALKAAPDTSEKPYPLIISSSKVAQIWAPYLSAAGSPG